MQYLHCDEKYLKEEKVKKQKCNIWSIKSWLDFLCFKQYPNVVHKISIVIDKKNGDNFEFCYN
jgi:hypothetical protein